jgi:8-oxo-dGTP pyrophosphatase MutT (NUDIX family)
MGEITIGSVERVEIAFEPRPWLFAIEQRAAIEGHFAQRQRERPGIWNGRVLLLHRYALTDGAFRGVCFETDYASFLAWRDWGQPDRTVGNYFGAAALRASDGAFLLGEMAPHTSSAGLIYFPSGMPDPSDLAFGKADLAHSVKRELKEETGLDIADFDAEPGWIVAIDGPYVAFLKLLRAREPAAELCARIHRQLARESEPEFAAIRIVRSPADFDSQMPAFVTAFLKEVWRGRL